MMLIIQERFHQVQFFVKLSHHTVCQNETRKYTTWTTHENAWYIATNKHAIGTILTMYSNATTSLHVCQLNSTYLWCYLPYNRCHHQLAVQSGELCMDDTSLVMVSELCLQPVHPSP